MKEDRANIANVNIRGNLGKSIQDLSMLFLQVPIS